MKCSELKSLLAWTAAGCATPEEQAMAQAHCAACSHCAALLETYLKTSAKHHSAALELDHLQITPPFEQKEILTFLDSRNEKASAASLASQADHPGCAWWRIALPLALAASLVLLLVIAPWRTAPVREASASPSPSSQPASPPVRILPQSMASYRSALASDDATALDRLLAKNAHSFKSDPQSNLQMREFSKAGL
jgi:hypothetical protein